MKRVFISGLGAVSPAGWSVGEMRQALKRGEPIPTQSVERPGSPKSLRFRPSPPLAARPAFLNHPRLRRVSPLSHYAAAAALEAIAQYQAAREHSIQREASLHAPTLPRSDAPTRLGLILCLQTGQVQYVSRFLEEIFKDPATASPLVFPETVFAAPISHIAAVLGHAPVAYTLLGDPGSFLAGLALAAQWLEDYSLDACLVVGAEELNWVLIEALWQFQHQPIASAGAGAICVSANEAASLGIELNAITSVHTYSSRTGPAQAACAMRAELPTRSPGELLCDGLGGARRSAIAEQAAWRDWTGPRLSPKQVLGEGLMAAAAWQCVAACDAVATGRFPAATVSLVGCDQQAIGARFVATGSG